jgi:hypothetical protein
VRMEKHTLQRLGHEDSVAKYDSSKIATFLNKPRTAAFA